ncbi:hypothetical protein SNE25_09515 [Mucilaginibacter sabulilitoris]|uniref:Uncharacterized protein n=1 Tax=Mucilaginibacter sabulilitoris TaxID=1173583 RepID=A0ABZ0TXA7_9SPHI|nr:hypothetical protein [Mucilaginibacter sabulilitoris]WPU95755.1 hypothetical protein SNE25_09515 [Mucilaginibacter sabulilitoris]
MLKNELTILSSVLTQHLGGQAGANRKRSIDFSKVILKSCSRAMEEWSIAAFSDHSEESLSRYFNFHFNFLNGLIAEKWQVSQCEGLNDLCQLLEHLLAYYHKFIDKEQLVTIGFIAFRMNPFRVKYEQFIDHLNQMSVDDLLAKYLMESLSPMYTVQPTEPLKLSDLFYREELISELANKRIHPELMRAESLISTLISFNFNHTHFLTYLRKRALNGIQQVPPADYSKYFGGLMSCVPTIDLTNSRRYDANWPHISSMYKDWLSDYGTLLTLTMPRHEDTLIVTKVPLTVSVKQLACMIRTFYESGFYGNISLTAIFDHAATVFTTKRQEHISAESISNAYYAISQSSALKVTRMLSHAIDFLKPYCFPG